MRFYDRAKTDGSVWWWEERRSDGSVKRHPLMPYNYIAAAPPLEHRGTPLCLA